MNSQIGFERCRTFIICNLQPPRAVLAPHNAGHLRSVTISRQSGSGGHSVAEKLRELLQSQTPKEEPAWTVFDRNLVEKVLEDHHLPKRLARFMPEDRISEMADTMDELFGLHPPSWTLVRQTAETILHLAELGHVILIGRGANVITNKLEYVVHVRLVAPFDQRVKYLQELEHLTPHAAQQLVQREDLGRTRYLKKYFGKDIDDALLYHLVINTARAPFDEAARLIAHAVTHKAAPITLPLHN